MSSTFNIEQSQKNELSLQDKVGQLFMPAVFINDTEEEVQKMEKLIHEHCIGSICFFHSRASAATNFEGKKKIVYNEKSYERLKQLIERYQTAAKIPLLVAIDAEWGLAMRIENTPQLPYAITLGAIQNNNDLIKDVGQRIGMDCKEAGIHWNLAPVVDINNNPENPVIGYRSFGDNREDVLAKAEAFITGMQNSGILNSIKHFPGHGDTATDSHLGLPVIDKSLEELNENELYPFHELIKKGVDSVMVGHLSLPQLDNENPSTTSSKIITGLLRKELSFEGVIISDALNMHAVSKKYPEKGSLEEKSFMAGMDVLCFSENVKEGVEHIISSASSERIEESFERVWKLKEKVFGKNPNIGEPLHKSVSEINKDIAANSITELYGSPKDVQNLKTSEFLNLAIGNGKKNIFSKKIEQLSGFEANENLLDFDALETKISKYENIVLALFPPAVKPKDNFGFDGTSLNFIKKLIEEKNVLIYLFGNPYVLDILNLKPTSNVVLVYQDFPEFQEEAFNHFKGDLVTKGKLPIKLKTFRV